MTALVPANWPAPKSVKAFVTTRQGGVSDSPFDGFNLALHVEDNPERVEQNRLRLNELLADRANHPLLPLVWGTQVHDVDVVDLPLDTVHLSLIESSHPSIEADAFYTQKVNQPCLVMTADCLPVVFCSQSGDEVAVAHAGWRGLANGAMEQTLKKFNSPANEVMAWLGPAIGAEQFEVGADVRKAFLDYSNDPDILTKLESAFTPSLNSTAEQPKYLADIFTLARIRLNASGVDAIYGGGDCTVSQPDKYYSYRRDGKTGRMATLVWFE